MPLVTPAAPVIRIAGNPQNDPVPLGLEMIGKLLGVLELRAESDAAMNRIDAKGIKARLWDEALVALDIVGSL